MKQKAVITQPGKLGDILITAPIAKYYSDLGHEVYWPVFDNFIGLVERFKFIKPISLGVSLHSSDYYSSKRGNFGTSNNHPEDTPAYRSSLFFDKFYRQFEQQDFKLIDACFAFPGHKKMSNLEQLHIYRQINKNWINLKYDLTATPLRERWKLQYERNLDKEKELLQFIKKYAIKKFGSEEFSIVHKYNSDRLPEYAPKNPINFSFIKGYEIVDWLQVLENAQEIVCVDSCLCNYVEVMPSLKEIKKVYLGSEEEHFNPVMRNILFNNWVNMSPLEINYGLSGVEDL